MKNSCTAIFSSAYFPPIDYISALLRSERACVEGHETYQKQTYRNRCRIFAADGIMDLYIPVLRGNVHLPIQDILIDYGKPWLQQHKRALISAYRSSPFFEYYQDELFAILDSRIDTLLQLNLALTAKVLELIGLPRPLEVTSTYETEYGPDFLDYRGSIHPKKPSPLWSDRIQLKPYYQVFSDKYGFQSNLSILDLLFCEGPNAISYLVDTGNLLELKSQGQ